MDGPVTTKNITTVVKRHNIVKLKDWKSWVVCYEAWGLTESALTHESISLDIVDMLNEVINILKKQAGLEGVLFVWSVGGQLQSSGVGCIKILTRI